MNHFSVLTSRAPPVVCRTTPRRASIVKPQRTIEADVSYDTLKKVEHTLHGAILLEFKSVPLSEEEEEEEEEEHRGSERFVLSSN